MAWQTGDAGADAARGQSSVLGFALMTGLAMAVVAATVLLGATAISDTRDRATAIKAEQAFSHIDSQGANVALGDSDSRSVDLGLDTASGGSVTTRYTGEIALETDDGTVLLEQRLGAVEFDNDDTTIAYQGGGVWRNDGPESRMVSPPELHYRDGTLTMPVVVLSPAAGGDGGSVTLRKKDAAYDVGMPRVRNQVLTVRVTSRYYAGWAQYFETRVPGADVEVYHGNETMTAELGRIEFPVDTEHAILAEGGDVEVSTGNSYVEGPVAAGGSITTGAASTINGTTTEGYGSSLATLDSLIDRRVDDAYANPGEYLSIPANRTLQGGEQYFVPGDLTLHGAALEAALDNESATLIVDGDVDVRNGGEVQVTDPGSGDAALRVFTTGNLTLKNGKMYVETTNRSDVDARHLQVYGRSDMEVGIANGGSYFEGIVYAPRTEEAPGENEAFPTAQSQCELDGGSYADVCIATGNAAVDGSIVAGPAAIKQSTEVYFDHTLAGLSLDLYASDVIAPKLSFLHVSVNQVAVAGPATTDPAALDSPEPAIDDVTVTETAGGHDVTVDWSADGPDLRNVTVTATELGGARSSESTTVSVGGSSASGQETLSFGTGSSDDYLVVVALTNADGNTVSRATTATCDGC